MRIVPVMGVKSSLPVSPRQIAAAILAGLVLRLLFIFQFPFRAGDTKFYEELARNLLDHHAYALFVRGQLVSVDVRMPGYPAFLALVYATVGRADKTVMVCQAAVDLTACLLTALLAARLAPASRRSFTATLALWFAALCPFTGNYTAVLLTEDLATFFTTLALLVFVRILADTRDNGFQELLQERTVYPFAGRFFAGGLVVGIGTLVRPETPLILMAVGIVLAIRWRHPADWRKLVLAGLWMAVGLLLPLTPWAMRNALTLGRIEFLSPRYAETQGDYVVRGVHAWTGTWMVRSEDAYLVPWKLNKEPILFDTLPADAFDSDSQRARVAALLNAYNQSVQLTPALDEQFASLARERTSRHPLRTYLFIPARRAWNMWFAPRTAMLRYSETLWPPHIHWQNNRAEFSVTLVFAALDYLLVSLALFSAWYCRASPGVTFLMTFVILRTAFLTQLQTVEPRYTIVCFPALLAIEALAGARLVPPSLQCSRT